MNKTEIIKELRLVYGGEPWYGDGVRELLDKVPSASAEYLHDRKSIAGILAHMIAWREYAIESLQGGSSKDMSQDSLDEWPLVENGNWQGLMQQLERSQLALIQGLEGVEDEKLEEMTPGKKYSLRTLLSGIVQHDIYHLGQIGLMHAMYGHLDAKDENA